MFWPPAGLALAAFMLCGGRAVVGVWLGALITQGVLFSGDFNQETLTAMLAMASGSTAQAALVAWLIGRWVGWGQWATPASHQRMMRTTPLRMAAMMLVVFTLATPLAASVGTASLVWSGQVPLFSVALVWRTWWLGDLAGVLGFGLPLFFLMTYWRKKTCQRDPVALCLAGLLMGAGLLAFAINEQSDTDQKIELLEADANELIAMNAGLMQAQLTQVIALKAFFESSEEVTPDEFQTFSTQLLANDPITRALSWVPRVRASERADFERQIQQNGYPLFFIYEANDDKTQVVADTRKEYFPLAYMAPLVPYLSLLGFDLGTDPLRHNVIQSAGDSGKITASAPVHLLQGQGVLPAVLTLAPVYHPNLPLRTVEQRQQALKGVVVSAFEPNTRFAEIRAGLRPTHNEFFVFDQESSPDGVKSELIAWSMLTSVITPPLDLEPAQLRQGLYVERLFEIAGRERLMIVRPSLSSFEILGHWDNWLTLLFSGVLAATLLYFNGRREAQDQTLHQSDAARQEEAEFIKQLLAQLPIGVVVCELQGDVIDANPAFSAIVGRPHAQIRGLSVAQMTAPEFAALDAEQAQRLHSTGIYGPYEKEYLRPDGSRVPVLVRGLRTEWNGKPVILSVTEDISARRKSEFQLTQAQKMDAIGQLTGGLAHDFNNMLGVIIGNLDLLSSLLIGNEAAQAKLATALTAALRGADLTRALLAVARAQTISAEPVDLSGRLKELLPLVRHTAGNMIEVTLTLDANPVVEVDPGGLASTVLNLVINARDAMPQGGHLTLLTKLRTVTAGSATLLKPGQYAELSVSDTGTGMSAEVLARALEPFFTTKERGRGTGLGLSMAHGFVKQCGGDMTLYSEPGYGTTLRLMLPITAPSTVAATATPNTDAVGPEVLPRGHERVLVVDDEIELLAITATWIKALGYEVTPCARPDSALTALQDGLTAGQPYALLVTDIIMPGMDGFALASAARLKQPQLALLYISGFADAADRGRDRPGGAVLEKPFRQPALATMVRQALDQHIKETL